VRPTVSVELEAVVLKALAKVPADRFQTGHEFAEALRNPDKAQIARWTTTSRVFTARDMPAGMATSPSSRTRRRLAIAALAVAVPVLAVGGWAWRAARSRADAGSTIANAKKIAVMYFDDVSSGHTLGYVADGLTEGLIDQLKGVRSLSVISKNGVQPFKGGTVSPDSIGRTLSVGTLVRGDVETSNGQLRVTVRLVDAASGADFERASFAEPAARVLVLEDTLASQVARMIRRRLGQEIQLRSEREATQSADAWALVQQAEERRKEGERRMTTNDTTGMLAAFAGSDSLLLRARALDGRWPQPALDRALIDYRASRFFGDDQTRAARWIDSGVVQAGLALASSPKNPTAFELRGTLRYWRYLLNIEPDPKKADDSLAAAQSDLETATRLNPAQAGAWAALSHLYAVKLDMPGSKLAARRAYEEDAYLSNADLVVWRLFTTSYDLEQFAEAKHWCAIGQQRFHAETRFAECGLRMMATSAATPDIPRAWRLADSLVADAPSGERAFRRWQAPVLTAAALAKAGLADSARHVLARVDVPAAVDPTRDIAMDEAFAWTLVGDKDAALKQLTLFVTANPRAGSGLGNDNGWRFRALRTDPRFQALTQPETSAR
jgi:TolB-like protein